MRILVINAGSSSLKFRVIPMTRSGAAGDGPMLGGQVSPIGGTAELVATDGSGEQSYGQRPIPGHFEAVQWVLEVLKHHRADPVEAVGHRVVHGGDLFRESVRLDAVVLRQLDRLSELAPLHNPGAVAGVRAVRSVLGERIPMVAVFDTAFHRTLPEAAALYAIPADVATRLGIRRYGFHGIAHASLAAAYARSTSRSLIGQRLITLQLGNGASITAVRDGQSVDTSMGFSPLEGLVMGTRAGDLDPAIVSYLVKREGMSADQVERWLNQDSGLLGVSGLSNDTRQLLAAETRGHAGAKRALLLFCYRARKYLGAYLAVLGGADAVIFGGGIGEHSPEIRQRVCEGMDWCGLVLDAQANRTATGLRPGSAQRISTATSHPAIFVAAADEESFIAQETVRVLDARPTSSPA